jgi:hypothetical protein
MPITLQVGHTYRDRGGDLRVARRTVDGSTGAAEAASLRRFTEEGARLPIFEVAFTDGVGSDGWRTADGVYWSARSDPNHSSHLVEEVWDGTVPDIAPAAPAREFITDRTPTQDGVYEVKVKDTISARRYSKWANGQWHEVSDSETRAVRNTARSGWCYNSRRFGGWRPLPGQPVPEPATTDEEAPPPVTSADPTDPSAYLVQFLAWCDANGFDFDTVLATARKRHEEAA